MALATVILALITGIAIPLASGGNMRRADIAWTPPPTAAATPTAPAVTQTPVALLAADTPLPRPTATATLIRPTATATPVAGTTVAATMAPMITAPPTATTAPQPTPTKQPPIATPSAALIVKIGVEPLNLRVGPGTDFATLGLARLGEIYDLRGRNADGSWYQVCCVRNAPAWVKAEFVEPDGAVDTLPIVP